MELRLKKTADAKMNIPWASPNFGGKEKEYLLDALESTWISGGPYVERLEKEFLELHRSPYGVAVSNGTTALELALLALGVGPGDEVVVPGFTFVAPANMVLALGATPVYADIDPAPWCLDPKAAERAITRKTKAILPVHVYGNVCDMAALLEIARRHKVAIVEDTAEAAFSKFNDGFAGTFGDLGCFSFQATKTITTGEGGFVLTRRKDLWEKMRMIRDHGMRKGKRYWHDVVGHNFRLTNLQAAVGCAQLERLPEILRARETMYRLYGERLSGLEGVTMQRFRAEVKPVVWAVAAQIAPDRFTGDRDRLIGNLAERGIETRPGFYPFSAMPLYKAPRLPVSEAVGANVISLPSSPFMTEAQIDYTCDHFRRLLKRP